MTTSSPIPRPGDVVSLSFDFLDGTGSKIRPAVVLSNRTFNAAWGLFVFAPITGSMGPVGGALEIQDLAVARLNRRCYVHGYLFTANNNRVLRTQGTFSSPDLARLRALLRGVLSL